MKPRGDANEVICLEDEKEKGEKSQIMKTH